MFLFGEDPEGWYDIEFVGESTPRRIYVREARYQMTGEPLYLMQSDTVIYPWRNIIKVTLIKKENTNAI